ncbi:Cyp18a1 [Cordylochernes scorpioides]|uniref:Cyp18a1 n=1 Tax=Cordylochernes scorpioides TaxID=51811 RepID=A0ABY6K0Y7_9ARAC|nr:Cyp18a1 [Cordylochernes scorpioides]
MNAREWIDHRRHSIHVLRNLGLNKSVLFQNILEEIDHFCSALESYGGKPIDSREIITHSVSNIIYALVFGRRIDYNDPIKKQLDYHILQSSESLDLTGASNYMPWLSWLLAKTGLSKQHVAAKGLREVQKYVK